MMFYAHRTAAYSALLLITLSFQVQTASAQTITHQITLPSGATWCSDAAITSLFDNINGFRQQNGVPALTLDSTGMKVAEVRAVQFSQYIATHAPGTAGFNPHEGYDTTAASLGYALVSENLAYITSDPYYIVYGGWQGSLHRAALLANDANVAGVSCIYANGIPYWTYEPGVRQGSGTPPVTTPPNPTTTTLDSEQAAFLSLINTYRALNNAGPLQVSAILQTASQWMSEDLAAKNYFSHTDSLGRSTGARLAAFGYSYSPWGENIAAGYSDAQNALDQWINACDPDNSGKCTYAHRLNMLNSGFKAIGIGRAYKAGSAYGWYWTTDFGGFVESGGTPTPTPVPVISSFTGTPSSIAAGQAALLTWNVSGATTAVIDNGIGAVSGTGSRSVSPSQTTTYRLSASNGGGTTSAAVTITVIPVSPGDLQPPSTPTLLSAVATSSTQVNLTWSPSSDNTGVTGYQVLRNGQVLVSVGGTTGAYTNVNAVANTTYTYAVRAFDAAGNMSTPSNIISVTTPGTPSATVCPAPVFGAFTGCYYNNLTLAGSPVFTRTDTQVNFDWFGGSPDATVSPKNFSARWQGYFNFDQSDYAFTATTSDGMRVYIDGVMVLDRWYDQTSMQYNFRRSLTQGSHLVVVEYYERSGTAIAHLSWQSETPRPRGGTVQAPAIASFAPSPSSISTGQSSTLSWSISGATSVVINNGVGDVTNLTSKTVAPGQTTTYTLTAINSAGSSVASTTVVVSAATSDLQPPSTPVLISAIAQSAAQVNLSWTTSTDNVGVAGYQILRGGTVMATVSASTLAYSDVSTAGSTTYAYAVKAYDSAGNVSAASNSVSVSTPGGTPAGTCSAPGASVFTGCYYSNPTLSGTPAVIRTDAVINFDWMARSPDRSMPPGAFSVRWQGNFGFDAGDYTFTSITSDGMRVYVDGSLILDSWKDQTASVYTVNRTLTQGTHSIVVEYYERTGVAAAHLTWQMVPPRGR